MKKRLVYFAIVVVAVLHQDFWFWHDRTLVFGFLPIGLAYHAFYSCLAAALWFAVMRYAWPEELEQFAERGWQEGDAERR